jgi:2-phosphosulfolactate phosphatase
VKKTVRIDAFPEAAYRCLDRDAIVAVHVISATTALVSSAAAGRATFVVPNVKSAYELSERLGDALLAGEVGGVVPEGFELPASPTALAAASGKRPAVVLAPPGTQILVNASAAPAVYVACLRNISATVGTIASAHPRVAIIGAGQGGDLRCEDQLAVARLAQGLMDQGYEAENPFTVDLVTRWAKVGTGLVALGRSAEQLRRAGRARDLEFILAHVDDVGVACECVDGEVCLEGVAAERKAARSAVAEATTGRVVPFAFGARPALPKVSA